MILYPVVTPLTKFARLLRVGTCRCAAGVLAAGLLGSDAAAADRVEPPSLDLSIQYATRVVTDDGVLRESRYEEKMMRRPGHVWVARVLPAERHGIRHVNASGHDDGRAGLAHKHFDHVVLPRHIWIDKGQARIEFVNAAGRERIGVPPAEYENVEFDGSWQRSCYLVPPSVLASMRKLSRPSAAGTEWREREAGGAFERVLWDAARQIPLVMESGSRDGRTYTRVEIRIDRGLAPGLPWTRIGGYAAREYADFLD